MFEIALPTAKIVTWGLNIIAFFCPYVGFLMVTIWVGARIEPLIGGTFGFIVGIVIGVIAGYLWDKFVLRKFWKKDILSVSYWVDKVVVRWIKKQKN